MSLNDVALLSQVCAAVLGIPSLIYLALQIRQNTEQARASAHYQFLEINKDLNLALITSGHMASVFRRGSENYEALDADEQVQFFFFIAQYYQAFSTMHGLWRQDLLPGDAWHPIRKHSISMMEQKGMRHVWDSWGRTGLPAGFVSYVEALCASGEDTYSLQSALAGRQYAGPAP